MPKPKILILESRNEYVEVVGEENETFQNLIARSRLLIGNAGVLAGIVLETLIEPRISPNKQGTSLSLPYAFLFTEDHGRLKLERFFSAERNHGDFTTHLVERSCHV